MPIGKLLETARGRMLLVNVYDMATENLLTPDRLKLAMRGLRTALSMLPTGYSEEHLIDSLKRAIFPQADRLHLSATEAPPPDVYIAAIRTFDEVATILRRSRKPTSNPRDITRTLREKASEAIRMRAADLVNEKARRLPQLVIGGSFNFFWATTLQKLRELEAAFISTSAPKPGNFANHVRDRLGLVQIRPLPTGEPTHIYAFESQLTLGEMAAKLDFRAARPTIIDGFDNPRFRQLRPPGAVPAPGFGFTVDLAKGAFGLGEPEIVSTEIPIQDNFVCRYVGKVTADPSGADEEFASWLHEGRNLAEMSAHLSALK